MTESLCRLQPASPVLHGRRYQRQLQQACNHAAHDVGAVAGDQIANQRMAINHLAGNGANLDDLAIQSWHFAPAITTVFIGINDCAALVGVFG